MRKALRFVAALALAASGLTVSASASPAQPGDINCASPPVNNPGVTVPAPAPIGNFEAVGDEDPCLERVRTLVFIGTADITNGVNFAGTGTGGTGGGFDFKAADANDPVGCMMVDWSSLESTSAPEIIVSDCNFSTTVGEYHNPTAPNPIINPIGAGLESGGPGYQGLDWAPANQASCINSDGSGTSSFTSMGLDGSSQVWSAQYTWTNSLSNLRGRVWNGQPSQRGSVAEFDFDAKVQTQANPFSGGPEERTAAGCLEKTANALLGAGPNQSATVGLNSVLVVGTATWDSRIPTVL